jgi:hypothetical protein
MPDILTKLQPDRDLQCYFFNPSAIAAMSEATPMSFKVTGSWRQQFDWAVIEWNRDNVFEHPAFRNLPDGDLSGITLTYDERRTNCIPLDSDLFATVDWPSLRIWASTGGVEQLYKVHLNDDDHKTAIEGSYQSATADFVLGGTITQDDYIGLAWTGEHYTHQAYFDDTIESVINQLVLAVNAVSPIMHAEQIGTDTIRLTYVGQGQTFGASTSGANGNRFGIYSLISGVGTESWNLPWQQMSGGTSPTAWRITLPFASLHYEGGGTSTVPVTAVRKMRWTYSADFQPASYVRSDFEVAITNWSVTGTNLTYKVAGPGSRRINDDDTSALTYTSGDWTTVTGNFYGATIHQTAKHGASFTCRYNTPLAHSLYLGTRYTNVGAVISVTLDGHTLDAISSNIAGEDVLARIHLGELSAGSHTLVVTNTSADGTLELGPSFYFDFVEIAISVTSLPAFPSIPSTTLATDWDTNHSIALPPERTAWMIHSLGFQGRLNHYVGALWFFEMIRDGHSYASAPVTFTGTPAPDAITTISIGLSDPMGSPQTLIEHLNLIGDTPTTIAKAYELMLNDGYTAVWAQASGNVLTIYSRTMGNAGNNLQVSGTPTSGAFQAIGSGPFTGGSDGLWHTDLGSTNKVNRAAKDWARAFFVAAKGYGIDACAAFSTELQFADTSLTAGIAQRYPSGHPVTLNTPAIQTNFSPTSLAYWKNVHLEMATVFQDAAMQPFLQFGEVQWWYFADDNDGTLPVPAPLPGLPFYDDYTKAAFHAAYGRDLAFIANGSVLPSLYPDEAAFLPTLIGAFTAAIMSYVRATISNCRFEVLYPPDVNDTPFDRAINFPAGDWTSTALDCLKTESFSYTGARNLNKSQQSIDFSANAGFPASKRSHLIGISDPISPWIKEYNMALEENLESVVLFALDQFCLIGYPLPIDGGIRRSVSFG